MKLKEKLVEILNRQMQEKSHTAYTLSNLASIHGLSIDPRTINYYRSGKSFGLDNIEELLKIMGTSLEIKAETKE